MSKKLLLEQNISELCYGLALEHFCSQDDPSTTTINTQMGTNTTWEPLVYADLGVCDPNVFCDGTTGWAPELTECNMLGMLPSNLTASTYLNMYLDNGLDPNSPVSLYDYYEAGIGSSAAVANWGGIIQDIIEGWQGGGGYFSNGMFPDGSSMCGCYNQYGSNNNIEACEGDYSADWDEPGCMMPWATNFNPLATEPCVEEGIENGCCTAFGWGQNCWGYYNFPSNWGGNMGGGQAISVNGINAEITSDFWASEYGSSWSPSSLDNYGAVMQWSDLDTIFGIDPCSDQWMETYCDSEHQYPWTEANNPNGNQSALMQSVCDACPCGPYDQVGCQDDGQQPWSVIPGIPALNFDPEANYPAPWNVPSYGLTWVINLMDCQYPEVGCTDPNACNYDPEADTDDDSCEYTSCAGCTESDYFNYDSEATIADDSCIPFIIGCMDENATNYGTVFSFEPENFATSTNPDINLDTPNTACDDCCEYPPEGCTIEEADNYDPEAVVDDGSCIISGCTDDGALNYNPNANNDDGSCEFPEIPGCTDENSESYNPEATTPCITTDDDGNEIENGCCEYIGCMDGTEDDGTPIAINYDPNATIPCDKCCEYPPDPPVIGCLDEGALNYNENADVACDDCCNYPDCEMIIGLFPNWCTDLCAEPYGEGYDQSLYCSGCCDPAVYGCMDEIAENYNPDATIDDGSCKYIEGCTNPNAANYNPNATLDDGSCIIKGCTDPAAENYDPEATSDDGTCIYPEFCCDMTALQYNDNEYANSIYYEYGYDTLMAVLNGTYEYCNNSLCEYDPPQVPGCMDPNALNFDSSATIDDNSCEYPEGCEGWFMQINYVGISNDFFCGNMCVTNPSGNNCECCCELEEYANSDYCPEPTIEGCTDEDALNYNAEATLDDGSCEYGYCYEEVSLVSEAMAYLDNLDLVYNVTDYEEGDTYWNYGFVSFWGGYESEGGSACTNICAGDNQPIDWIMVTCMECCNCMCNPQDNNCCCPDYGDTCNPGCMDPNAINYNSEATFNDGSCEYEPEVPGCMDENALNYNAEATFDDGSCEYEPEISGCTDPAAINYNAEATTDDGSCEYEAEPCETYNTWDESTQIMFCNSFFNLENPEDDPQLNDILDGGACCPSDPGPVECSCMCGDLNGDGVADEADLQMQQDLSDGVISFDEVPCLHNVIVSDPVSQLGAGGVDPNNNIFNYWIIQNSDVPDEELINVGVCYNTETSNELQNPEVFNAIINSGCVDYTPLEGCEGQWEEIDGWPGVTPEIFCNEQSQCNPDDPFANDPLIIGTQEYPGCSCCCELESAEDYSWCDTPPVIGCMDPAALNYDENATVACVPDCCEYDVEPFSCPPIDDLQGMEQFLNSVGIENSPLFCDRCTDTDNPGWPDWWAVFGDDVDTPYCQCCPGQDEFSCNDFDSFVETLDILDQSDPEEEFCARCNLDSYIYADNQGGYEYWMSLYGETWCTCCQYGPPIPVYGCMDDTATNYNPNATLDDGSCEYESGCPFDDPSEFTQWLTTGGTGDPDITDINGLDYSDPQIFCDKCTNPLSASQFNNLGLADYIPYCFCCPDGDFPPLPPSKPQKGEINKSLRDRFKKLANIK